MGHYRFYELDLAGRIIKAADMEASDDGVAIRQAEEVARKAGGIRFELWQGARIVATSKGF